MGKVNENSSMLWLKHLDYISRERIQRLIKESVLHDLNISNFDTSINCIKEKLPTRGRKEK